MTIDELKNYRIGKNKNIVVFERDIGNIVYGSDIEGYMTTSEPTPGNVPYFKVSTANIWLKMFLI